MIRIDHLGPDVFFENPVKLPGTCFSQVLRRYAGKLESCGCPDQPDGIIEHGDGQFQEGVFVGGVKGGYSSETDQGIRI
jgi:hypothetical protein